MTIFIKNLQNKLDFELRKKIKWSKGEYNPPNEQKDNLFENFSFKKAKIAIEKESYYLKKYHLEHFKNNSKKRTYLENLAMIELLENHLKIPEEQNNIKLLDIGSKNWFYAVGEYHFFKYNNNSDRTIFLNGIELDANRLYSDLHSRKDYALYHIKDLANARYITGNLLEHQEKYDYITWFFPFLTPKPLIEWGLPLNYLKPTQMLEHAINLLKPKGKMIILNQGNQEYQIQKNLLEKTKISFSQEGEATSIFINYENTRLVTLLKKGN